MDFYPYAKLLHIIFAAFWIGGGVAMILLGFAAALARDDDRLVRVVLQVVWLSERFYIPSSLLTVIFGAAMVWFAHSFADLWIVLGLGGFALTFVTGVFIIKPMAEKVAATFATEGSSPTAAAISRRILRTAVFDYVAIVLVAAVMVLKPTAADVGLLLAMGAILVGAGLVCLARPRRATAIA
ncbi:hypothetical protein RHIZO_00858 [Rhizobiaceae bacterium]|nr:hypothetical protein RHIZO_00858 [Rhizobiaceae bacterium]